MKATVHLESLLTMIGLVRVKAPGQKRGDERLRLSVCNGMVYVEANQFVCGVESLVLEDGACNVPLVKFAKVLATYKPKKVLIIEADERGLRIGGFSMPVRAYTPAAVPPGNYERLTLPERLTWEERERR